MSIIHNSGIVIFRPGPGIAGVLIMDEKTGSEFQEAIHRSDMFCKHLPASLKFVQELNRPRRTGISGKRC